MPQDQTLADVTPGDDDEQDNEKGVRHYTEGDRREGQGGDEMLGDHDVPGDLLELHTALEAQEAGML